MQGQPIGNVDSSITAGPRGPTLLEDALLLKELAQFDRERIPERVAHAKGTKLMFSPQETKKIEKFQFLNV